MSKDDKGDGCGSIIFITLIIALLFNGCVAGVGGAEGTEFSWSMMTKSFMITWAVLLGFGGLAVFNS